MISRTGRGLGQDGFLLIEVLAAFLVLSVGVLASFHCLGRSLAASNKARVMEMETAEMDEVLFELEGRPLSGRPVLTLDSWSGNPKDLYALR